ncbi:MAG TPA: IS200/IS605 family transposase [Thermoanaerobaculia bacterium]|jgi:REP element-mobilizing transposase RayT
MSSHTHFLYFLYHIVFSTKEREPLITPEAREPLYRYIGGIIRKRRGICIEIGGVMDHVHILARFRPSISVSKMVQDIKGISSKWAKGRLRTTKALYWQDGYGGFSVGSEVDDVIAYIRNQEAHHRELSFKEELVDLLDRHGVEYDPRYLWD